MRVMAEARVHEEGEVRASLVLAPSLPGHGWAALALLCPPSLVSAGALALVTLESSALPEFLPTVSSGWVGC